MGYLVCNTDVLPQPRRMALRRLQRDECGLVGRLAANAVHHFTAYPLQQPLDLPLGLGLPPFLASVSIPPFFRAFLTSVPQNGWFVTGAWTPTPRRCRSIRQRTILAINRCKPSERPWLRGRRKVGTLVVCGEQDKPEVGTEVALYLLLG